MSIGSDPPRSSMVAGTDVAGTVRDKVRQILTQHGRLAGPVDHLSDASDLYRAGLTSLATVGLMLALEDEFGIEFPDAMLGRKTFSSIDSLVAAIAALRAAGKAPVCSGD